MPRHFGLNRGELQLIAAIMKSDGFPGLEELRLTPETKLGLPVRDGLVRKGLLKAGEDGRFALNRTTGYIFSEILREKEFLRGDVLFADGGSARLNLYFVEDSFLLIAWDGEDALDCVWMPTIQLAMGALIHYVSEPEQLKALPERAQKPGTAFAFALGGRRFSVKVGEAGLFSEDDGPRTVAEFLAPLSREVLRIHQRKISEVTHE